MLRAKVSPRIAEIMVQRLGKRRQAIALGAGQLSTCHERAAVFEGTLLGVESLRWLLFAHDDHRLRVGRSRAHQLLSRVCLAHYFFLVGVCRVCTNDTFN